MSKSNPEFDPYPVESLGWFAAKAILHSCNNAGLLDDKGFPIAGKAKSDAEIELYSLGMGAVAIIDICRKAGFVKPAPLHQGEYVWDYSVSLNRK